MMAKRWLGFLLGACTLAASGQQSTDKGGFRYAVVPQWPNQTIDLGPVREIVAEDARTRCGTGYAARPMDLGMNSELLGVLDRDAGKPKRPKTHKDPIKKKRKRLFEDNASGTRLRVGNTLNDEGLLVSADIDKSRSRGTFHALFLEFSDCTRIFPSRLRIYDLWSRWKPQPSVIKTRRTYREGVLVDPTAEAPGWETRDVIAYSAGFSLLESSAELGGVRLVLDAGAAFRGQLVDQIGSPVWAEQGFSEPTQGLRRIGASFARVNGQVLSRAILIVHVTHVEADAYHTVGFALQPTPDGTGGFAFTQMDVR